MRIAFLFHQAERDPSNYLIHQLAEIWREDGHTVDYLMGFGRRVSADVLLVHVDLSVVPESYLEYASSFPVVLNGNLRDIRKSSVSKNLLQQHESWRGPVIVKSDRNFHGWPEQQLEANWLERSIPWLQRAHAKLDRMRGLDPLAFAPEGYRIFDGVEQIPEKWFSHPRIVVEKFLPEMEDGYFHVRMFMFLGRRERCIRLRSKERVIKAGNSLAAEDVEPHRAVGEGRRDFSADYGKIDYVVHNGEPVLLDLNKTIGVSHDYRDEETLRANRRFLAEGVYDLLA